MKTQQRTFSTIEALDKSVAMLEMQGFKELSFYKKRVPRGTQVKKIFKLRVWHGEWAGYASHVASILYK